MWLGEDEEVMENFGGENSWKKNPRRWDGIKIDLGELGCLDERLMNLDYDRVQLHIVGDVEYLIPATRILVRL
jgi:hypothetical protein